MSPPFQVDDLSDDQLEQIRRFIEQGDELSDEMHALVEKSTTHNGQLANCTGFPSSFHTRALV